MINFMLGVIALMMFNVVLHSLGFTGPLYYVWCFVSGFLYPRFYQRFLA